jgi:hypothetical protein
LHQIAVQFGALGLQGMDYGRGRHAGGYSVSAKRGPFWRGEVRE